MNPAVVLRSVGLMFFALLNAAAGSEPASQNDIAALVKRVRLLETRLSEIDGASSVLEVGAVELTIPAGETNASTKVLFDRQWAGPVIILTGESGTAGSWVLTKSSRITEHDFELNVIDNENKVRDTPYTSRIGYVVLKADTKALTGALTSPPAADAAGDDIVEASRQLATIALGRPAKDSDKLLKQFENSLLLIRGTYPDIPPKEVAALIFAAHKQLGKFDKPLPLERVAHLIATAIPRNQSPSTHFSLNDVAAGFVGGYVGGDDDRNPNRAATDARALMEALIAGADASERQAK